MTRFLYPDPGQPQPLFTPPPTPPSRPGQRAFRLVGIVLLLAAGIGAAYLTVRVFGPPPEWLRWALLAPALLYVGYKRRKSRRQEEPSRNLEPRPPV